MVLRQKIEQLANGLLRVKKVAAGVSLGAAVSLDVVPRDDKTQRDNTP